MVRWFEGKFQVQRLVYIKPLTSIRNFLNTRTSLFNVNELVMTTAVK